MHIISDLDGTLVDTRTAVGAAYFHAGVEMPADAWGKPWREWLPALVGSEERALQVHAVKCKVYPDMLAHYGKVLPLGRVLKDGRFTLLTGASAQGAVAALALADLEAEELNAARFGLTVEEKIAHVLNTAMNESQGVYFDDHEVTCQRVRRGFEEIGSRWQVCHVTGLHDD